MKDSGPRDLFTEPSHSNLDKDISKKEAALIAKKIDSILELTFSLEEDIIVDGGAFVIHRANDDSRGWLWHESQNIQEGSGASIRDVSFLEPEGELGLELEFSFTRDTETGIDGTNYYFSADGSMLKVNFQETHDNRSGASMMSGDLELVRLALDSMEARIRQLGLLDDGQ